MNITIIILVHNNQKYLDRIICYYANFPGLKLTVADSSIEPLSINKPVLPENFIYYHLPNISLTKKIALAIDKVTTKYTVLLGVDDFILVSSLEKCGKFLDEHDEYSSAIGNDIFFKLKGPSISFSPVYGFLPQSIDDNDPIKRLAVFFERYRAIYCAVQKTVLLKKVFMASEGSVTQLYLNEYLTGVYPILCGKHKSFEDIHTVREYDEQSNGFISIGLLHIIEKDKKGFDDFLEINAGLVSPFLDHNLVKNNVNACMKKFAEKQIKDTAAAKMPFSKKVGKIILLIPYFGNLIVQKRRAKAEAKKIADVIKNEADIKNIEAVKYCIINSVLR